MNFIIKIKIRYIINVGAKKPINIEPNKSKKLFGDLELSEVLALSIILIDGLITA